MPAAASHASAGPRRGFTLVELLVVLGIFMLLMGLTIGAVMRTPRLDRILGAEAAVGDAIRQARHTARSTGQPVVLLLTKDKREIGGLVRTPLWSGLEHWPQPKDAGGNAFDMPGRTGMGLYVGSDANGAYGDPAAPDPAKILLPNMPPELSSKLERNQRLARGVTTEAPPGLLLTLWVRPPAATASSPVFLPLAMIGPDDAPPPPPPAPSTDTNFANQGRSAFGLALWRVDPNAVPGSPTAMPDARPGPPLVCWDAIGWLNDGSSTVSVSSLDKGQAARDQVRDEPQSNLVMAAGGGSPAVTATDIAAPLYGGTWTEIGLLFDGARLVLYRDGRRIAETACSPTQFTLLANVSTATAERVFVGAGRPPASVDPLQKLIAAAGATIDDVRLERLGQSMAGRFPPGVVPDKDRRIVCHPDGRVEVDFDAAAAYSGTPGGAQAVSVANGNTITLRAVSDAGATTPASDYAELEVSLDGTVSSTTKAMP